MTETTVATSLSETDILREALTNLLRGAGVAKLGLARDGVQHAKLVQMEGIATTALATPRVTGTKAVLEDAIAFIESLAVVPLLMSDDIEMRLQDVQKHARIEAASLRKRMIAAAPAPTPSPAAKGGEAVQEAAQAVINSATNTYRKRNGQRGTIEGDDGEMAWIVPFDPFEELRAALSTPTEGPASQTEGMGGDADGPLPCPFCGSPAKLISTMGEWVGGGYGPSGSRYVCSSPYTNPSRICEGSGAFHGPNQDAEALAAWNTRAALTPPETAEAVPDDLTAAYMAGVERGRDELRAERDDAVNMAAALAEVVASSEYKLESGDRYSVSLYTANRMVDLARHLLAARASLATEASR